MEPLVSRRKFLQKSVAGAGLALAATGLTQTMARGATDQFLGKFRGIVVNVEDPEGLGRIQAQVPEVFGEGGISTWALPAVPFAGSNHGLFLIPEVGDSVWIEFEQGDANRPIVSGSLWNSSSEIPSPAGIKTRVLATSGGHKIILDELENKISLLHPGGAEITLANDLIALQIGETNLTISPRGVFVNGKLLKLTHDNK